MLEGRALEWIQDEDVSLGWGESGDLLLLHPDRREAIVPALLVSQGESLSHCLQEESGGNDKPVEVVS